MNAALAMVDQYVKDDAALTKSYFRISFYMQTGDYKKMMTTVPERFS